MASDPHAAETHASPLGPRQYVIIGLVLTVITMVELAVSYSTLVKSLMIAILIILSAVKFATVVALFMHLRFESRLFTQLFMFGLILGAAILLALTSLFWHDPTDALGSVSAGSAANAGQLLLQHAGVL